MVQSLHIGARPFGPAADTMRTLTTPRGRERAGRRLLARLALAVCVAAASACGASSKTAATATRAASGNYSKAVRFANCMRAHGVPDFPDPSATGGIQIPDNSGTNPFSPAFKTAQRACRALLPRGGGPRKASAQQKAQFLALAQCMRAHGVTGFPDPVGSPPSNPSGFSAIFGLQGAFIEIPSTINMQAPTFRQAMAACGFPGAG